MYEFLSDQVAAGLYSYSASGLGLIVGSSVGAGGFVQENPDALIAGALLAVCCLGNVLYEHYAAKNEEAIHLQNQRRVSPTLDSFVDS